MRSTTIASAVLTACFVIPTSAQLIPFLTKGEPLIPEGILDTLNDSPPPKNQRPMDPNANAPGIQLPNNPTSGSGSSDDKDPNRNDAVILSDVIGSDSSINIFAGFTASIASLSTRLETSSLNSTVLAPLNKAITALPRKPWEDPREYAALGSTAYDGAEGEDRAQRNMRRFAEAHVVPQSPWGEGEKVETLGGGKVWWEIKDGKQVIMPGSVVVQKVAQRVANGEVWVVEGVLNYAE